MTVLTPSRLRRAGALLRGALPSAGPNFFIVGATRAGTTWLHHALRAHPDIFLPEKKELQYFNRDHRYSPDLRGYREQFWGYSGQQLVGEATPLYMVAHAVYDNDETLRIGGIGDAVERIARHFPDAKLVVSLRDPATRMLSIYEKNLRQGKVDTPLQTLLAQELDGDPSKLNLLYLNDYRAHLQNIFRHFPHDRVMIMIFEEWRSELSSWIERLQAFLGVEPHFREPAIREARNRRERYGALDGRRIRELAIVPDELMARALSSLAPSRAWVEALVGRRLPWT